MSARNEHENRRKVALAWFLLIAIVMGQLGVLVSLANRAWSAGCICDAIYEQMVSGNFLTFSTAFLASSIYFLIREYAQGEPISNTVKKSTFLLMAVSLGMVAVVFTYLMITDHSTMGVAKRLLHWLIYISSIMLGLKFWNMEYEESGRRVTQQLQDDADNLTKDAQNKNAASDGTEL